MDDSLKLTSRGQKAYLNIGDKHEMEISKDVMLEICQTILGNIQERDYTSISSIRKLLTIIKLECEPDESEDEVLEQKQVKKPLPVKKNVPQSESDDDDD